MKKIELRSVHPVALRARFGLALASATIACGSAWAQQATPANRPAPVATIAPATPKLATGEEHESATPNKPGEQGIHIHGHWLIDIKNPDGKLVKHLDFENSLTTGGGAGTDQGSSGDQIVAALLSGSASASDPGIAFIQAPSPGSSIPAGTDVSGVCSGGSGVPGYKCGILTTAQSLTNYYTGFALSVQNGLTSTVNFRPLVNWVLSGNFTVPATGMTYLTAVQTLLPVCVSNNSFLAQTFDYSLQGSGPGESETVAPSGCNYTASKSGPLTLTYGPLTQTIVQGAPQTVTPGQIITVVVTISFS